MTEGSSDRAGSVQFALPHSTALWYTGSAIACADDGSRCYSSNLRYRWQGTELSTVTLRDIEQIFTVLERLGISREDVVIPLRPDNPGGARRLPNAKYEIVVNDAVPIDEWLPVLEAQLRALKQS
jgi:hypothetical protein